MSELEKIVNAAVMRVIVNAANFPDPAVTKLLGQDMRPLGDKITREVLQELAKRSETFTQYRAVIGRPWNILDRTLPRGAQIFETTSPMSADAKARFRLQRSEEDHTWIERWEMRTCVAEHWEELREQDSK